MVQQEIIIGNPQATIQTARHCPRMIRSSIEKDNKKLGLGDAAHLKLYSNSGLVIRRCTIYKFLINTLNCRKQRQRVFARAHPAAQLPQSMLWSTLCWVLRARSSKGIIGSRDTFDSFILNAYESIWKVAIQKAATTAIAAAANAPMPAAAVGIAAPV